MKKAKRILSRTLRPYRQASRKQTSAAIVAVLFLTTTILVYDATHQSFPLEGVEFPSEATGEGEWMIAVNETQDQAPMITAWNLSTTESFVVGGAPMGNPPSVEISGDKMAIYADFRFDWFVIDTSFGTISPEFRNDLGTRINDLAIGTMADGTSYVAVLNDEGISILYASGLELAKIPDAAGATALTAYGDSVIWSDNGSNGPKLGIFSVSSETRQDIFVNASASDETESGLMDAEIFVDPVNGTITEISADSTSIAAVVDVGQIRRVVLVDRVAGSSAIISEPAWGCMEPSSYRR